jgi:uncharacterized membrane protein YjjP (DUF1212 family)
MGHDKVRHGIEISKRRQFILKLAKALLTFGAPSHRIESQLLAASNILDAQAGLSFSRQFLEITNLIVPRIRSSSEYRHSLNSK